jgi:hypothetical protein
MVMVGLGRRGLRGVRCLVLGDTNLRSDLVEKIFVHEASEQGRSCVGAGVAGQVDAGEVPGEVSEAGVRGGSGGLPLLGTPRVP